MSKNLALLLVASLIAAVISAVILGENLSGAMGAGYVVGSALVTVAAAVIIAAIPAGIYWLVKRRRMPGLNAAIWVAWVLIFALTLAGNLSR